MAKKNENKEKLFCQKFKKKKHFLFLFFWEVIQILIARSLKSLKSYSKMAFLLFFISKMNDHLLPKIFYALE